MTASAIRLLPNGDPETGLGPSNLVAPDSFLGSDRTETIHTPFTNARGNVTAGVWECAPCLETFERYGVDELCAVLIGSVTITDADGTAQTFGPGDTFVMPRDFKGSWHITETLKKFYMIVEPPAET